MTTTKVHQFHSAALPRPLVDDLFQRHFNDVLKRSVYTAESTPDVEAIRVADPVAVTAELLVEWWGTFDMLDDETGLVVFPLTLAGALDQAEAIDGQRGATVAEMMVAVDERLQELCDDIEGGSGHYDPIGDSAVAYLYQRFRKALDVNPSAS